jgi:TctA family transporter
MDKPEIETNNVDDQFRSLMEGLRTTLPGVQVLFAFLLVLPLQAEFATIRDMERIAYYVAFYGSAMASVLLIAPSAHQRLRAPISGMERRSEAHLQIAVSLSIAGTVIFAIALAAAVFLISTLTLTDSVAVGATVAVAAVIAWSWFYIPLVTFERH